MTEDWTLLSFFSWYSSWQWPATKFLAKNTAKLQGQRSTSVVTDKEGKKVKQKMKKRIHPDRNQVTDIPDGVGERSVVTILRV